MNAKEFFDSLKKVFADLLPLKTADSNYAVSLFNKADGTPAGLMDLPALASVLGGAKQVNNPTALKKAYSEVTYGIISNTTTDSPCAYGFYLAFPARNPNNASNNGFILVFPHDAKTIYLDVSWDTSGYYGYWRKVSLTDVTQ